MGMQNKVEYERDEVEAVETVDEVLGPSYAVGSRWMGTGTARRHKLELNLGTLFM